MLTILLMDLDIGINGFQEGFNGIQKKVIIRIFSYIKVKCKIIKMDEYILLDVELIIV